MKERLYLYISRDTLPFTPKPHTKMQLVSYLIVKFAGKLRPRISLQNNAKST